MGLADKNKDSGKKQEQIKPKENIETDLDKVYYAVLEKKKIALKEVADKLKISSGKAEELARILDKQGLVELYYPAIGEIELRAKTGDKKEESKPKNKKKRLFLFALLLIVVMIIIVFFMMR